jgi:hypothetical protein
LAGRERLRLLHHLPHGFLRMSGRAQRFSAKGRKIIKLPDSNRRVFIE